MKHAALPLELAGMCFDSIGPEALSGDAAAGRLTPGVFALLNKRELKTDVARYVNRILEPMQQALADPASPLQALYAQLAPAPV